MASHKIKLSTLHDIDKGVAEILFDREIAKAIADCRDRAALQKPREVTLKVRLVPHQNDPEDVIVTLEVTPCKVPGSVSDPVRMQTNGKNEATFQSESNDNPHQPDLGFETAGDAEN